MQDYKYKTDPFDHQDERFRLYRDRIFHAILWEQRTGKSKVTIDTSAWLHLRGQITAVLLIAPNGVHINWALNEVPTHMPDYVGCEPVTYVSTPNAAQRKDLEKITKTTGHGLRFLTMNIEAVRTKKGFAFAMNFLNSYRCLLVVDEGSIIKTFDSSQTEAVLKLAPYAAYRRLLNGTPVTQGPLDIFPQFLFLDSHIFYTTSWYAFRARYAILETQGAMKRKVNAELARIIGSLNRYAWGDPIVSEEAGIITAGQQPLDDDSKLDFTVRNQGRNFCTIRWSCNGQSGERSIPIEAGDSYKVISGYQRLDELQTLILPHSDRILKCDCLDLPEKVYQKRYVELSTKQRKMYDDLKKRCIAECNGRHVTANNALTKLLRLQQIIGGFFVPDQNLQLELFDTYDEETLVEFFESKVEAVQIEECPPRLVALLEDIAQSQDRKVIIWAKFRPEMDMIATALRKEYGPQSVGLAHGGVAADVRQATINDFQQDDSTLRFLVANPQCKGVSRGQNLCKASDEYYYSNSFSLEDRLQSEDRPHSPGQKSSVGVIDLIARDTMDEKVINALRAKKELADMVTGDRIREWI